MAQQRNRRKARVVSDHAMLALHKYYLRAEHMRMQASKAREELIAKYGVASLRSRTASLERFSLEMYIDYWYAGIFAALEGYDKLALFDPDVERCRADPRYPKLRAYRGGVYHFSEKYFDDAIREFLADGSSGSWMTNLDMALGRFLLEELQKRRNARSNPSDEASLISRDAVTLERE